MTKEVARIEKGGTLKTDGVLLERSVKDYSSHMVHHFGFDSDLASDTSNWMTTLPIELAPNAYNLLDALGMDWRDPDMWEGSNPSSTRTCKYLPEYDCLEIVGNQGLTLRKMLPIFHDLGFNFSLEVMHIAGPSQMYAGAKHYGHSGNALAQGAGVHTTSSWDYIGMAGNGVAADGKWHLYHNALTAGKPRTGVASTGNDVWRSRDNKFWRPLILANYNKGEDSICRVRNLRVWYTGTKGKIYNNGHTTQSAPIKSVTNLITHAPKMRDSSGWGGMKAKAEKYIMPDGSDGMHYTITRDGSASGGVGYNRFLDWADVSPSKWYSLSVLVKSSEMALTHNNLFYIREYDSTNKQIREYGVFSHAWKTHVGDGWYLCSTNFTTHANAAHILIESYNYAPNVEIWVGNATFVEGRRALSLPIGETTSEYHLSITNRQLSSWTVFGSFIQGERINNDTPYGEGVGNGGALIKFYDQDRGWTGMRYWRGGTGDSRYAVPYLNPNVNTQWNNTTANKNQGLNNANLAAGNQYYFQFSYRASDKDLRFRIFNADGTVRYQFTTDKNVIVAPKLSEIKVGGQTWGAMWKFITVYDKFMESSDITHLIKSNMNVDGGGIRDLISEEQSISDLYSVDMSAHENKKFGTGYATRAPKPNLLPIVSAANGWSDVRNHTEMVDTPYGMGYKYMSGAMTAHWGGADGIHGNDDDTGIYGYTIYQTPAGTFSGGDRAYFSSWVYVSEDCNCDNVRISFETHSGGATFYNTDKKGTWQFVKIRSVIDAGHTQARVLLYPSGRAGTWGEVGPHFDGFIIFAGTALTQDAAGDLMPYVGNPADTGYRGMKFNLHDDYHIDFSRDWTITYEMMPMSGHDNKANGYVIDSLGSNSNSIGGGYIWWGKASGNISVIYDGTPNVVNPNYWHNWRRVTATYDKSANKLYIYDHGYDGMRVRSITQTITKPDHYICQHGYDLLLGGHDNQNIHGAIYRDLKVGQVYKSQAEVETYYSQGLNISKESVNVREIVECKL